MITVCKKSTKMANLLRRDPSSSIRSLRIAYLWLRELCCRQKPVECPKSWTLIDLPCLRRINSSKSNNKKRSIPSLSRRLKLKQLLDQELIGRLREEPSPITPLPKLPWRVKIKRVWTTTPDHWHRWPKIPYHRSSKPELVKTQTAGASKITSPIQRNLPLTPWWSSRGFLNTKRKFMVRR